MTGPALAVVEALLSAPIAWRSPAHLAAGSGLDLSAVFCALADLEAAELITHWETDDELTVTLTPIGAARLNVRLIEVGPDELPRWATPDTPEPDPPVAKGIFRDYSALALVPGPALPPEEVLEAAELVALADRGDDPDARGSRRGGAVPRLFAGSATPWDGPFSTYPCVVCWSKPSLTYCLVCDSFGLQSAKTTSKRNRSRAARRSVDARTDRKARLKARFS